EKRAKYPNVFVFWENVKVQSIRQYSKMVSDEKYVCEKTKQTKIIKTLESEDVVIDSGEDPFNETLVKCSKEIGNKIQAHYVSDVSPKRTYIISDGPRKESIMHFFKMLFLENVVHIFHISDWKEFDLPIFPKSIIELYKGVSEVAGDKTVLVQNSRGVEPRVFIFVYFRCILEKMITDGTTSNPMEIVKMVRERCQGGNISVSEYSFLITSLITYFFENGFLVDKSDERIKLRSDFDDFMYEARYVENDVDKNLVPLVRFIKATDAGKLLDIVKESRDVQKVRNKCVTREKCRRFFAVLRDPKLKGRIRYDSVSCLDNASVFIGDGPTFELSSFIHANEMIYDIKGGFKRKIIMCQAPVPETFEHMYDMIFKYNVGIIVILVSSAEAKIKPPKWSPYLPAKDKKLESKSYIIIGKGGSRTDELSITETNYTIAQKSDDKKFINFKVYHYETWPDGSVPKTPISVLELYKRIISDNEANRNIIIHCSAGIGRTGTLALIILMIDTIYSSKSFNPIKSLDFLRKHRFRAVQTDSQFLFAITIVLEVFKDDLIKIDSRLYSGFVETIKNIYKR
uniref:Protein-tyrosine-phosphatase n=1 Tax=Parastrongyloides trichosuri TaxID=131310 RepID=A0A0N4Z429_PARTI